MTERDPSWVYDPMAPNRLPKPPQEYHDKAHPRTPGAWQECDRCLRGLMKCQRKRVYFSRDEAQAAMTQFNEDREYKDTMKYYRCRHCLQWHLTHKTGKAARKRIEKQRRHWLILKRLEEQRENHNHRSQGEERHGDAPRSGDHRVDFPGVPDLRSETGQPVLPHDGGKGPGNQ